MIIYDLSCSNGHRFEGWFRDAADFESQAARALINCPQCDTSEVRRVPSAVAISAGRRGGDDEPTPGNEAGASESYALRSGGELLAAYRHFVKLLRANSEDVGDAFAEEARKIHYQETPERAIRGNATAEECSALEEEGIAVIRLPVIKGDDFN